CWCTGRSRPPTGCRLYRSRVLIDRADAAARHVVHIALYPGIRGEQWMSAQVLDLRTYGLPHIRSERQEIPSGHAGSQRSSEPLTQLVVGDVEQATPRMVNDKHVACA